jgi:hypothetical protein
MDCSVDGCHRAAEKRGWCGGHYFRWRKHGSPAGGRVRNGIQRAYVESFVDPKTDECVIWPFPGNDNGYGRKFSGEGYVHQIICEKFHGPKPSELHEVAHSCGKRPCINPRHIRWATPSNNNKDKVTHGTQQSKLTEADVIAIRSSSLTCRKAAEIYGVAASTINKIRLRKTWDRKGI